MNMSDCAGMTPGRLQAMCFSSRPHSGTGLSQSPGPPQIEDGQKPGATEGPSMLKKESGNRERDFSFFKLPVCLTMLKEHFNFCSDNLSICLCGQLWGFLSRAKVCCSCWLLQCVCVAFLPRWMDGRTDPQT